MWIVILMGRGKLGELLPTHHHSGLGYSEAHENANRITSFETTFILEQVPELDF
jgi:hypothetical protein